MSSTSQAAELKQQKSKHWRNSHTPKVRPLTAKIFLVTGIFGVIVPLLRLLVLIIQHRDVTFIGEWFHHFGRSVSGETSLAVMATQLYGLQGYLIPLLPLFFVILHGQTIELLHRTLHSEETNPRIKPEQEEAKSSGKSLTLENGTRSTEGSAYGLWYRLYGLFRNIKWFQGLLSGPTLGAFLRVALLPLPLLYDASSPGPWAARFRWWANKCPWIALFLAALVTTMWAADTGWFSLFNGPLMAFVILGAVLLLWPWVWKGLNLLGALIASQFAKPRWTAQVETSAAAMVPRPANTWWARQWRKLGLLYCRWARLCPWIFMALVAILIGAILDASDRIPFPKLPTWFLVFSIALWPWMWLFLRIVGRMFLVKRLYHRAQLYIEVHHLMKKLMKDASSRSGIDTAYVLRAKLFEAQSGPPETRKLPPIACESLFELYQANEDDQIKTYFETQELLPPLTLQGWWFFVRYWLFFVNKTEEQKDQYDETWKEAESLLTATELPQFYCPVKVKLGFICPTYLISGLLAEFDEDWKKIVRSYGLDMESLATDDPLKDWPELRKLQIFIWDCWIQWGPSVPVCQSQNWTTGKIGLQFGYGDENNSIPMTWSPRATEITPHANGGGETPTEPVATSVAETNYSDSDWSSWEPLFRGFQNEGAIGGSIRSASLPFVIPAEVEANLRWIAGESTIKKFCEAQQRDEAWLSLEAREITPKWDSPKMYSAYVWVIIAICVRDDANPGHAKLVFDFDRDHPEEGQVWRGLIPFFQHGNVAEESAYHDIKEELAAKTVETLMTILEKDHLRDGRHIEFAYVCAYDDNGDPNPETSRSSVPLGGYPAKSIRRMMNRSLNRYAAKYAPNITDLPQIKQRIHLSHDAIDSISACDLPDIAEQYLQFIGESLELKETKYVDLYDSEQYAHVLKKMHEGLYLKSFPDESERETLAQHYHRLFGEGKTQFPQTHCIVAGKDLEDSEACVIHGFLILEWYPKSKCGLFSYLAVSRGFRDRGIAQELVQRGIAILHACNEGSTPEMVFAETAKPGDSFAWDAPSKMHEGDRIRVLHKLGASRIPLQNYVQPALEHGKDPATHLTMLAFNPVLRATAAESPECTTVKRSVVLGFLEEFYQALGVNDPNMNPEYQKMKQELDELPNKPKDDSKIYEMPFVTITP